MRCRVRQLAVAGLFVMLTALVRAGDVPKSADHPLIKRYEGSTIVQYSQKAFDEYRLVVGPVVGRGDQAHFPKTRALEGRVTRITYLVPEGRSTLEVIRNYELELEKAGFTTLFAGAHEALGERGWLRARWLPWRRPAGDPELDNQLARLEGRSVSRRTARPTTR